MYVTLTINFNVLLLHKLIYIYLLGKGIDYCSHAPCMMHGICVPKQNKYHCICQPRYSGNNCEIDNGKSYILMY